MSRSKNLFVALIVLVLSSVLGGISALAKDEGIKVGDKAPDFSLPAQDGSTVSLKDFAGKKAVVLYFYPKDNTPICTKEACSFRDEYDVFTKKNAEVIGVSSDSVDSHKEFATQQHLQFKLLSDKDGELRKAFGVPKTAKLMPGRVTYVIDKAGVVRLVFNSQLDSKKHVDEALAVLAEIDKG